jgi:hypothetical protein
MIMYFALTRQALLTAALPLRWGHRSHLPTPVPMEPSGSVLAGRYAPTVARRKATEREPPMAENTNTLPLLTEKEFKALDLCNELAGLLTEIIAEGAAENAEDPGIKKGVGQLAWTSNVFPPLWTLRAFIKAQAAARAYPEDERLGLMGQ